MIKTAIFVEGQTELILVREMLLRLFEYQNICLECFKLLKGNTRPTEYPFGERSAVYYFQIISVGGDDAVLTSILKLEKYLWNSGFDRIIGLRDMFSKNYRKLSRERKIDLSLNQKFIEGSRKTIEEKAEQPDKIFFSFAIMEAEAWLLGIPIAFERMNEDLTIKNIAKSLNINLNEIDPETEFFHPSNQVKAIFDLTENKYKKRKGDVSALVNCMKKENYDMLHESEKCASFSTFYKHLPSQE